MHPTCFKKSKFWFSLMVVFTIIIFPNTIPSQIKDYNLDGGKKLAPVQYYPNIGGNFNSTANYEWWNVSWAFRIAIEINSSSIARYWWQCDFYLNFTDILKQANSSGSMDNRSVRVVEYNSTGVMSFYNDSLAGSLKYVIPSKFLMEKVYYNAQTNATGHLYFPLTGDTAKNTNRTYFVYFDILEHGSKTNQYELSWDKDYFGATDAARDQKYRIASGCYYDTGGYTGREYIFKNSTSEWSTQVSGWSGDQICGNVVFDWNQDGKLEIGVFNYESREMMFYTYVSPGVMTQFISSPIALSSHTPRSAAIGDVDKDGVMELIVASQEDEGITIYRYATSSPYFILETKISTPARDLDLGALAVYDLDHDDYPEIIAGTTVTATTTRLCIWEYNPATTTYDLRLNNVDTSKYQDSDILHCGDFDFDGNVEIISANSYHSATQIYVWQCTGDNTYQYEMTFNCQLTYPTVGDVTDYDNDGRYELVVSDGTDSTGTIHFYEYMGNGAINSTNERQISVDSAITPTKHPLIIDNDNDGSVELVMNGKDGRLACYEFGTGTTSYSSDFGSYIGGGYVSGSSAMGQNFLVLGRRRNCDAYPQIITQFYKPEIAFSNIFLTLKDNDNNYITGARVSIINSVTGQLVTDSKYSDSMGQVSFPRVLFNQTSPFNVTTHLISPNPLFAGNESIVYNKTIHIFSQTYTDTLFLNVWTINFDVTDYTGNPISRGYVAIYNDTLRSNSQLIQNLSISQSGTCRFQWTNRSFYNYTVSYYNPYYKIPFIVLTNDTVGITHIGNSTSTAQVQGLITQAQITVIDSQSIPAAGVKVSICVNNSDIVAELYTDGYGEARDAQGQYFLNQLSSIVGNYTVNLTYYGKSKVFRNGSDVNDPFTGSKNITLNVGTSLLYQMSVDSSKYNLVLEELELLSNFSLPFRGSAHFSIELNATNNETGELVSDRVDASTNIIEIRDFLTSQLVLSAELNHVSTGLYDFTLNASAMGIIAGKNYYATITIIADGYGNQPSPLFYTFDVQAINTSITIQDALAQPISLVTVHWGQNFTVFINYTDQDWNVGIDGGSGNGWWDYGSYPLQQVMGQPGLYSVEVNSSDVQHIGTEIIKFQIGKTNYISYTEVSLTIKLLEITTSLNSSSDFFEKLNLQIYRMEALNFTFHYDDEINHIGIENALTQSYVWREYDSSAQLIRTGSGDLINIGSGSYVLDFDTEYLNGSRYTFFVSLDKPNYSPKFGFLSFDVNPIPLQVEFSNNLIESNYVLVVPNKGNIELQITLSDPIFGGTIAGAEISLELEGAELKFTEIGSGTYRLIFNAENHDAFFADITLLGKIKILEENYTTVTQDVKFIIKMDELLPGIPTFYFYLVLGFLITIVGVPLVIKVARYAKTPPFIKRATAIKHLIEKKKKTRLRKDVEYSMENIIAEQYKERWNLFKIRQNKKKPQRQAEAM